ncbi:SMP-30/gluconolactonase/LRE family protein [Humitalea sp. 24SJ18S-53]|uniref:SMP-30/gluconolactonase/LRE family protein n=1 Tax=Humitalea sp. 24SJ18S-53 TaxID=3422307 RepID=UPI003D66F28C
MTRLPEALHWKGEPTAWVRTTRPGQRLHSFLEGLSVDADGTAWMVDVPHGRILRVTPDGQWDVAFAYDGEPHGLCRLTDDAWVIADYRRGLLRLDLAEGRLSTLCAGVNTENFRGLSDLCRGPDGSIWFTDSGRSSLSDPTGRLFRRWPDGRLDLVLPNVPYPNGVVVGGSFVYLAATRANAVWRLLADAPDPLLPMVGTYVQLSGGLGPDGLAMDAQGRLAVAHAQAGTVWLFDAIGFPLLRIRTPGGLWTTSVAFSPDGRFLMIVEAQAGALHRVDLEQAQLELALAEEPIA